MEIKVLLTVALLWLLGVAGWVTNAIWTFNQADIAGVLMGILGALVFPIGAIHGIYLWF